MIIANCCIGRRENFSSSRSRSAGLIFGVGGSGCSPFWSPFCSGPGSASSTGSLTRYIRRDPVFKPTRTRSPGFALDASYRLVGAHTVGKNGLDLRLIALLELDDRPSSKSRQHDREFEASSVIPLSIRHRATVAGFRGSSLVLEVARRSSSERHCRPTRGSCAKHV